MSVRIRSWTAPYGIVEGRTATINPLTASAEEYETFVAVDDAAQAQRLLDSVERDVLEYWRSEGLPGEIGQRWRINEGPWQAEKPSYEVFLAAKSRVCCIEHPAELAAEGTWLHMSWSVWQNVQEARVAVAGGNIHKALVQGFIIGRKMAEIAISRRHGPDAKDGRGRKAARRNGGFAPKLDVDLWDEILAADAQLRAKNKKSTRNERAKQLSERFPRGFRAIFDRIPE